VTTELDPLIHVPTRLKIVATLAALPEGDALSFTRLQDMLELTPGNLIIQLRKLEDADYISSTKTGSGSAQRTTVALTKKGRAALSAYIQALRDLLGGLDVEATSPTAQSARLQLLTLTLGEPAHSLGLGADGALGRRALRSLACRARCRHAGGLGQVCRAWFSPAAGSGVPGPVAQAM
jgi:DNA-binding MarR family transcriptional regulator